MDEETLQAFRNAAAAAQSLPYVERNKALAEIQRKFSTFGGDPSQVGAAPAVPQIPGFQADGLTLKTPQGSVRMKRIDTDKVIPDPVFVENENAGKQAEAITKTFNRPYIKSAPVAAVLDPSGIIKKPAIPAVIGYQPMTLADFGQGAYNPDAATLNYKNGLPPVAMQPEVYNQIADLQDTSRNLVPRSEARPFVQSLFEDYAPLAQADFARQDQQRRRMTLGAPAPARNSAIIPMDPTAIPDAPVVSEPVAKKLDRGLAIGFLDQAKGDAEKARQLAKEAGYSW